MLPLNTSTQNSRSLRQLYLQDLPSSALSLFRFPALSACWAAHLLPAPRRCLSHSSLLLYTAPPIPAQAMILFQPLSSPLLLYLCCLTRLLPLSMLCCLSDHTLLPTR